MCGIVGYIGTKKAKPILINGLLRLEYRGYDSAGIATIENNGLKVVKNKGRVNDLNNTKGIDSLKGTIGIGHTRWATHGKPSSTNSHPHMDNSENFAVVHNGIIENYADLKEFLKSHKYKFLSETDTEVIPNLIHFYFESSKKTGNMRFLDAIANTCKMLKGSYALEILSSMYPDNMIVVRKDSPLVIGIGNGENYIASDIPAILSYTKNFYLLNDLEFALLSRENIKFYDNNLKEIHKTAISIEWNATAAEKDGFDDFMLKEIYEQPKSIRETIGSHIVKDGKCIIDGLDLSKDYLKTINKIFIVACGTAMHAGLACKNVLEQICEISTEVDIASEFRYRNPLINKNTLSSAYDELVSAAYKLKDGEYSTSIITTELGYHVILRTETKEKASLEDVKEDILETLGAEYLQENQVSAVKALQEKRKEYGVEIVDSELKAQYAELIQNQIAAYQEQQNQQKAHIYMEGEQLSIQ